MGFELSNSQLESFTTLPTLYTYSCCCSINKQSLCIWIFQHTLHNWKKQTQFSWSSERGFFFLFWPISRFPASIERRFDWFSSNFSFAAERSDQQLRLSRNRKRKRGWRVQGETNAWKGWNFSKHPHWERWPSEVSNPEPSGSMKLSCFWS